MASTAERKQQMKYSDIRVFETKCNRTAKYRLCKRGKINSSNGKFVSAFRCKVGPLPICETFSFAYINSDTVNDLFSEDGIYMLVENKDGDERVILPGELKTLLAREYDNIVADFHKYDEDDGSMFKPCLEILTAIDNNIK